jgi:hypothetical protein
MEKKTFIQLSLKSLKKCEFISQFQYLCDNMQRKEKEKKKTYTIFFYRNI